MTAFLLRALHLPPGIVFAIVFGGYALWAGYYVIDGYARELFGHNRYHTGRIHHVLYRFHTGQHVGTKHSYGDERNRTRTMVGSGRTAAGLNVYYSPWKRWHRCVRNNAIVVLVLLHICGMVIDPLLTVRIITAFLILALAACVVLLVLRARKRAAYRRPVSRPAFAQTTRAKAVFRADATTVAARPKLQIEAEPALEGVPAATLAAILAPEMGCSTAEVIDRMTLTPDEGRIVLPDSFSAVDRKKEMVEAIIVAHTKGKVRFAWTTTSVPRALSWFPVVEHRLPATVRFRDYLRELEALPARETGLGVNPDRSMCVQSHRGDLPMWCRFMGSGTGKSMGFLIKAAQIAHKDPLADLHCFDTKQISFEPLHGIPGIHIYNNPVTGMDEIYNGFYELAGVLESRYEAVRLGRVRLADLHDIWIFGDEGNHLGGKLATYAKRTGRENAAIWVEAIAPLLQQGRQANMFCEWMFQDLTDRAMGGQSLKFAFSAYIAAGFTPPQFTRTIGPPAPEIQTGPGRMLVCKGRDRDWVQGFIDDEQWLHDYALENRIGRAA